MKMRIHKYIPSRMYGFTVDDEGRQAFFHLGVFQPGVSSDLHPKCVACAHTSCSWIESPPPPIHGEQVEVDITFEDVEGGSAPRANKVIRLKTPLIMAGVVEVYYGTRGYGFIKSDTGQIFLHRSEMLDGKVPVQGQQVIFCVGTKEGKPRACYVKVCEHG